MGERVDGYELLESLGQGGMGVVYRARELQTGREVALKRIGADEVDEDLWLRFQREAQALAQVSHPNVLTVHGAGRTAKGPYLVTELVRGEDLDARLKRAGVLPPAEVVRLLSRLADAVAALHDAGMVHRDIKPGNVIVRPEGEPVLLDFGLVRVAGSSLTATGDLLGSPAYMSPEQATGDHRAVGPATDVYALGALGFALLVGRPPYEGGLYEVLDQVVTGQPSWGGEEPAGLRQVLTRAMHKDPASRFTSARELKAALESGLAPAPRRSAALVVAAGVALGALALVLRGAGPGPPQPGPSATSARSPGPVESAQPSAPTEPPVPATLQEALRTPRARYDVAGPVGARHGPDGRVVAWTLGGDPLLAQVFELDGNLGGEPARRWEAPAAGAMRAWWAAAQSPDRSQLLLGFLTNVLERRRRDIVRWREEKGPELLAWPRHKKLDALAISPAGRIGLALHWKEPQPKAEVWLADAPGEPPSKLLFVTPLPIVAELLFVSEERLLCVSTEPGRVGTQQIGRNRLELRDLEGGLLASVEASGYARTCCVDFARRWVFLGTEQPPSGFLFRPEGGLLAQAPRFGPPRPLSSGRFPKELNQPVRGFRAPPHQAVFDARDRLIVAMGHGTLPLAGGSRPSASYLHAWEVGAGDPIELAATHVEDETFYTLSVSPDAGWAVTGGIRGRRGRLSLWDLRPPR